MNFYFCISYRHSKLSNSKGKVFTLVVDYFLEIRLEFLLEDQTKRKKMVYSSEQAKEGKLNNGNFRYHLNKTLGNDSSYLECDKRRIGTGSNPKVLLVKQNNFLRQSGEHIQALDLEKV